MSNRWKAFWIWTGFILVLYVVASYLVSRDRVYTNFENPVSITRDILVVGDKPITFMAASSDFFILRPEIGGEPIIGESIAPPLGWDSKTYFIASGELTPGKWIFEKGSATFKLKSEGPITVTQLTDKGEIWIVFLLCALCFWFSGIAIAHM